MKKINNTNKTSRESKTDPANCIPMESRFALPFKQSLHYILSCQSTSGAIRWFKDGKLDPWDHTEALMALTIGGFLDEAQKGFNWLRENQNTDGSWFANYFSENSDTENIETNFVAYPATGLWHYYLVTQDISVLQVFFPMIEKAINYVLGHQTNEGDIQWAISTDKAVAKDALITACSSILRSVESAISCAQVLNADCEHWIPAYEKLFDALKNKPWRFDRTWESKERYSMDWFYPILAGVYGEQEARIRLKESWNKFYEKDIGCRCVSDEPWMTVAESCELSLALCAANKKEEAGNLLGDLLAWQDTDGGFWTGYNFRDKNIWPREKTTWTAGAFVLAIDATFNLSPASNLFTTPGSISN